MKVSECLNKIPDKQLGYIRMVDCVMGGEAHERTLDTYNSKELIECQSRDAHCYYNIGEYWYIVYSKSSTASK